MTTSKNLFLYTFTIPDDVNNEKYYFVCNNALKTKLYHRYDINNLREVTQYLQEKYPSCGYYDHDFNLPPGTVLNSKYEIIYRPTCSYLNINSDLCQNLGLDSPIKCKYIDGTYINIYSIAGKTLIGTKNSWDISHLNDIYTDTYLDLLQETLNVIKIKDMPKNGSYIFCNPKIHLMTEDYALHDFNNLQITDDNNQEYILFYPNIGAYTEVITEELKQVNKALYFYRNRFFSENSTLALLVCVLNLLSISKKTNNYIMRNKSLNSLALTCFRYIRRLKIELERINNNALFYDVKIPYKFIKKDCFHVKYTNFWKNVLVNALVKREISFTRFNVVK
jgi:hypothetical protein